MPLAVSAEAVVGSRPRATPSVRPKRSAHVVAVPAKAEPSTAAASIEKERRTVPTHRVVCAACGEEEFLGYRRSESIDYVCVACEERALYAGAQRRAILHWWPVAVVIVFLACGGAGLAWAVGQNKAPHDPVTPGEH